MVFRSRSPTVLKNTTYCLVPTLCTYLWCCVVSASKREGKEFGLSLMEFADSISPADMEAWSEAVTSEHKSEEGASGSEKKRPLPPENS